MRRISFVCLTGWILSLFMWTASLPAQIVIEPPRPIWPRPPREIPVLQPVELRQLAVDAQVRDQAAEVRLSQTFHNPNPGPMEAEYLFPVPEGSAIQNFVLMVDGQELPGKMMNAEEARKIYEEIVRRRRDPGLLQFVGRGLLKTSVFPIPGHGERTVTLRYTELLRKEDGRIDLRLPLGAPASAPPQSPPLSTARVRWQRTPTRHR